MGGVGGGGGVGEGGGVGAGGGLEEARGLKYRILKYLNRWLYVSL